MGEGSREERMKSKSGRNRRQPRKKRCRNTESGAQGSKDCGAQTFEGAADFFLMLKQRLTLDVLYGRTMAFNKAPLCIVKAASEETRIYGWG